MARIRLVVRGNLGEISARAFVQFIDHSLKILSELDRAVSDIPAGTLEWNISDLRPGSTVVELQSRVTRGEHDFAAQVSSAYKNGLQSLRTEHRTPALFTEDSVRLIRDVVRDIGRHGVSSAEVVLPDRNNEQVELTSDLEPNLQDLVGVHHRSLGAVEGKLELVSIHRPHRRFNVYSSLTGKGIKCTLPTRLESSVIAAMGRRVIASGLVSYNRAGEPLSVQVDALRILGESNELPGINDILGSMSDISDGLTTEEHLQRLRDG